QIKVRPESRFWNFFWRIVSVHRGKILALLCQNSVAMNVAIGAQIADNVERIIDVLERPPWLVPAVTPLPKVLFENLATIIVFDLRDDPAQLMQRTAGMRIEHGREYFVLRIGVVIDEGHGLVRTNLDSLRRPGRQASRRSRGFDQIIVDLGAFHERWNE